MNERIKKLAKKSGATLNEGFDGNKAFVYGITMSPEELEKFAELIVRECIEQVWYTREDMMNENISQVIKDRIKQHFGVEDPPVDNVDNVDRILRTVRTRNK